MQLVGSVLALVLVVVIDGFVDSLIRESGALGILRAEAVKDNCEAASGWGIAEGAGKKWGGPRPEAVGFREVVGFLPRPEEFGVVYPHDEVGTGFAAFLHVDQEGTIEDKVGRRRRHVHVRF